MKEIPDHHLSLDQGHEVGMKVTRFSGLGESSFGRMAETGQISKV